MARITTVAITLCVLIATLASSPEAATAARGAVRDPDGRLTTPIRVPLGEVEIRGLVHHERSARLVVAVDDQVSVFDLEGRLTATIEDVPGVMEPVEAGEFVVVGSPSARELIVIDPAAGTVVERIRTGVRGVSAIAATGDRVWYANSQWPDGIGVASIAAATASPAEDLGRLEVADGAQIGVSSARPGRVYLTDPAIAGLRWAHGDGGRASTGGSDSISSFVVAERGDVVWALTAEEDIVELDAETLGPTGFRFASPEGSEPSVTPGSTGAGTGAVTGAVTGGGLLASDDDQRLAAATGRRITSYDVGNAAPTAAVTLAGRVTALDLDLHDLYAVVADDTRPDIATSAPDAAPAASELLVIDRDAPPPSPVLAIGFSGLGDPATPTRGTVRLSCAGRVTAIPIRYGTSLELPVPTDVRTCELTIVGGPTPQHRHLITPSETEAIDVGAGPEAPEGGGAGSGGRSPAEPIAVAISGIAGNDRVDLVDRFPSALTDPAILTDQIFADLLGRAPTAVERGSWAAALADGTAPGELAAGLLATTDFQSQIAPVSRLYLAYFGRNPDDAGMAYWLAKVRAGMTIDEVSSAFGTSTEFGGDRATTGSDPEFVELLYRRVLGRAAEAEGAAYWTGALAGGASRSLIMAMFAGSPEFASRTEPAIAVRWLHRGLLGRDPDPAAGLYWRAVARGGGSLAGLVDQILTSPEYEERFWLRDPIDDGFVVGVPWAAGVRLQARSSPAWPGPDLLAVDRR